MTMYKRFRSWLEKWLRLPPEPLDPMGGENTLRVFRAAPRYYDYRLLWWKVALGFKILLSLAVFLGLTIGLGAAFGPLGVIGGCFLAALIVTALGFTSLVSYVTIRLDYEFRWYKTTDRSLRIREGVWLVREMTMTYANIQDISVSQGPLQRLFGIADLKVVTAGGGGGEAHQHQGTLFDMHTGYFRGVDNAPEIRDLMLERLRRLRDAGLGDLDDAGEASSTSPVLEKFAPADVLDLLRAIHDEARTLRVAAHRLAGRL
jgi:membrane protein YdbS with pleckstrin-like domain